MTKKTLYVHDGTGDLTDALQSITDWHIQNNPDHVDLDKLDQFRKKSGKSHMIRHLIYKERKRQIDQIKPESD